MNLQDHGGHAADVNAAMFCDFTDTGFIDAALDPYDVRSGPIVVCEDDFFRPEVASERRIHFADVGLDRVPIDEDHVLERMRDGIARVSGPSAIVTDMRWGLNTLHGADGYEIWGRIVETLSRELGLPILSLYDKELMIEDQMQAAFRAHRQFLAPSGLYENPFWLPPAILRDGTLDEQFGFMLGRVVPDYAGGPFFKHFEREAARGATPDWIAQDRNAVAPTGGAARWQIYCLGRLRVEIGGNREVDWQVPGGAAKKTRTLFAYLLHHSEKGAHADRISELLWPEDGSEKTKRARLHHTIAMLRRALGDQNAVERAGEYYRLNPPVGSWIDITSFEQLCRRGFSLARSGQMAAAIRIYFAAERLYGGDLFEDLPHEYVQSEHDDWCLARRTWLRDMAVKLQYDFSKLLRGQGRNGEALEHALKATSLDPWNEDAQAEALRVFFAQGRIEAMHRHYRHYRAAQDDSGNSIQGSDFQDVYDELCRLLTNMPPDQRKTKVLSLR